MKIIKLIIVIAIVILLIWIDLPENFPLKFNIGQLQVNTIINPLVIDTEIAGTKIKREFKTRLGLDLQGGSRLVFEADTRKIKQTDMADAVGGARDIIERRVNLFGVSEPSVQTVKSGNIYRIAVELPGISNVEDAVRLIGQTAQLIFKEEGNFDPKIASDAPEILRLNKETGLAGQDIKKAGVTFDNQSGKPLVTLEFTNKGASKFADITERNIGKRVAIYIDELPISAPTVKSAILDGSAVIEGDFTIDEAKKLAIAINSGALPLSVKLVEQKNIGPSLGAQDVKKSVYAGMIGLLMVLLFMIIYYGRLGLIASLALLIYGLISFAIFRIIPVVLTLPGITGFILSIGMAVDSNILIFERIKEEQRKGREFDTAIRLGFGRAIDAIKDANITTILVAFILFNPLNWGFLPQFGMVRGFALTLVIGVATSLFTGVVITKRLINFFYTRK